MINAIVRKIRSLDERGIIIEHLHFSNKHRVSPKELLLTLILDTRCLETVTTTSYNKGL